MSAAKPVRLEVVRRLVERSMRVRIAGRVLVVDDSSTMRSIVRKILGATQFAFDVNEAAEGAAALKLAREPNSTSYFSTITCQASTAWKRWPSSSARSGA